jgi:hypothetical protein
MNPLEEGNELQLDFTKLQKVAHPVVLNTRIFRLQENGCSNNHL